MSPNTHQIIQKCQRLLDNAPEIVQKQISKLLSALEGFLKSNSELVEKTAPILVDVCGHLLRKEYWEATSDLVLLLTLIRIRRRRPNEPDASK